MSVGLALPPDLVDTSRTLDKPAAAETLQLAMPGTPGVISTPCRQGGWILEYEKKVPSLQEAPANMVGTCANQGQVPKMTAMRMKVDETVFEEI